MSVGQGDIVWPDEGCHVGPGDIVWPDEGCRWVRVTSCGRTNVVTWVPCARNCDSNWNTSCDGVVTVNICIIIVAITITMIVYYYGC